MLNKDLPRLEMEIDFYREQAGLSIWEIGRRLNEVKEHHLAPGEFTNWLAKRQINHTAANRMMKIARELTQSATLPNLGMTALYLIASLPEETRENHFLTEKGDVKQPQDMSVKELRSLKASINVNDYQATTAENARLHQHIAQLEKELHDSHSKLSNLTQQYEEALKQPKDAPTPDQQLDQLKTEISQLSKRKEAYAFELTSLKNILKLKDQVSLLLSQISPLIFLPDIEYFQQDEVVLTNLMSLVGQVDQWCRKMFQLLNQPYVMDAKFVDVTDNP